MEIKGISWKYGWMERTVIIMYHRHTILKNGSRRSRSMKEKKQVTKQIVCCSEQELIQQFAGSEMKMDLQMIPHGQNQESVMVRFTMMKASVPEITKEIRQTDIPMDMKMVITGQYRRLMQELHPDGSGEHRKILQEL